MRQWRENVFFQRHSLSRAVLYCFFALLPVLPVSVFAASFYVETSANGGSDANDGTSWATAKATIQAALDLATAAGDRVYVAEGSYNAKITFPSHNDFQLLGGYPTGGGTQDPWTHTTIIDGATWGGPIVTIPGNTSTDQGYTGIVLDGFTIQNGSNGTYAAGLASWSTDLTIKRCVVQDNTTGADVGGIYVSSLMNDLSTRTLRIEETIVRNNSGYFGGILYDPIGITSLEITNTLVYGNHATGTAGDFSGGGVVIGTGSQDINTAKIINSTIADNTSAHGTNPVGGIAVNINFNPGVVEVTNSIVWNTDDDIYDLSAGGANLTLSYCNTQDSYTGTGLITTNPAFAGYEPEASNDYHLTAASGAIDSGTSSGAPAIDLEGTVRPQGAGYDMGSYEYDAVVVPQYTLSTSVSGGNGTLTPPSGNYDEGTVVDLVATPAAGYQVASWSGTDDDSLTTENNTVTMDSDKTVTVQFEVISVMQYTLTTGVAGGNGSLTPPGGDYDEGVVVELKAVPNPGYKVKTWIGTAADSATTNGNTVVMDSDHSVTVSFEKAEIAEEQWSRIFNSSIADYNAMFYGVDFLSDDTLLVAGRENDVSGNVWAGMGIRYNTADGTTLDAPPEWIRYTHSSGTYFKAQVIGAGGDIYFAGDEYGGNTGAVWKYDANGTPAAGWPKYTPNLTFLQDLALDSVGNVYVVGAYAVPYNWEVDDRDWLIYKYNSDGTIADGFPLPYFDHAGLYDTAYRIAVDSEDNFIVAGMISQTVAPGDPSNKDWLIQKYKSDGTLIWEKTVDGKGLDDWPRGILIDDKDNVIISGNLNNGTDNVDGTYHDAYFVKYSKVDGSILWEQTWDSGMSNFAEEMAADGEGNFYVAGRSINADGMWRPTVQYRNGENGALLKAQDLPYVATRNNTPKTESFAGVYITFRKGQLAVASYLYNTDATVKAYDNTAYLVLLDLVKEDGFPWTLFLPAITGSK